MTILWWIGLMVLASLGDYLQRRQRHHRWGYWAAAILGAMGFAAAAGFTYKDHFALGFLAWPGALAGGYAVARSSREFWGWLYRHRRLQH